MKNIPQNESEPNNSIIPVSPVYDVQTKTITSIARIVKHTPEELYNIYLNLFPKANAELIKKVDKTQFKYVMYLRKSRDEEDKQEFSLDQQKEECEKVRIKDKLNIVDIIEEEGSAKISDNRPQFRAILNEISKKSGTPKYNAILAYHPDRLARNMKEAGEIIDLIDNDKIKDLDFATHSFENSPSGVMMLGILFVLAKEYSDKMSIDSSRGMSYLIKNGKAMDTKHGYYLDKEKYLQPLIDPKTKVNQADIIKRAFELRLQNKSLKEIAEYVNSQNYIQCKLEHDSVDEHTYQRHIKFKMTVSVLSRIFADPFYAGIHIWGKRNLQIVNLREHYLFYPVVTIDDFLKINPELKDKLKFRSRSQGYGKETYLKDKVLCVCGAITYHDKPKEKPWYMRCKSSKCNAPARNTNIETIRNFAVDYLNKLTPEQKQNEFYSDYKLQFENEVKLQKSILTSNTIKLREAIKNEKNVIIQLNEKARDNLTTKAFELCAKQITESEKKLVDLEERYQVEKEILKNISEVPVTLQEFSELFTDLQDWLVKSDKKASTCQVLSDVFANFTVNGNEVVDCKLNRNYKEMFSCLKTILFADGDPTENRTPIAKLRTLCPNR